MNSLAHGNNTLAIEVTHISNHGIWLFAHHIELFLAYEDFPWFKDQPVKAILNVEEHGSGHYYWPEMDIDLTQEMIEHPERFPLVAESNGGRHD